MSLIALFFVLVYFTGLILAFVKKQPIWGLMSYLFAFYMHPPVRWWGDSLPDLRWSLTASILTLIVVLIAKGESKLKFFEFKENKLLLAFFVFLLVQSLWATSDIFHFYYVALFFKLLILIFIIQNSIKSQRDLLFFLAINAIGCSYFGYLGFTEHSGGRLETVGGPGLTSANQLAQHVGVILFFSAYLLLSNQSRTIKIFALVTTPILLETIMLTQSRTVIIAIVLTGMLAIFYPPPKAKKKFYTLTILGGFAFSILLGGQIVERLNQLAANNESQQQDKSAESRMVIIKSQWKMFLDKPIFGHGHRSTLILSPQYIPAEYRAANKRGSNAQTYRASHNFIMAMLVDHGIIGSALYFLVIFSCLRKAREIAKIRSDDTEIINLQTAGIGLGLALAFFMIVGLGSNNKVLEIDIWLYAIIPLVYQMLKDKDKVENLNDN
jgi:O-antigen ligase